MLVAVLSVETTQAHLELLVSMVVYDSSETAGIDGLTIALRIRQPAFVHFGTQLAGQHEPDSHQRLKRTLAFSVRLEACVCKVPYMRYKLQVPYFAYRWQMPTAR